MLNEVQASVPEMAPSEKARLRMRMPVKPMLAVAGTVMLWLKVLPEAVALLLATYSEAAYWPSRL